jgi:hypothetical protein
MNRIEISNLALNAIGARTIASLEDETNQEAKTMNLLYAPTMDEVMSMHPWVSATKRARVAAVVEEENLSSWGYKYRLPNDCITVLSLLSPDYFLEIERVEVNQHRKLSDRAIFEREGKYILTDITPGIIKYVYFPTDAEQLRDILGEAVAMRLAYKAAIKLGRDVNLTAMLMQGFELSLLRAKMAEAADSRSDPLVVKDWSQYRASYRNISDIEGTR